MRSYTYLLIDLGCIAIPFLASFYKKHAFYRAWPAFFLANFIVALPFLIWDEWFTEWGVWGFDPDYLMGIYLGHLPLEEILFFFCIPYACVFTYFSLRYLVRKNPLHSIAQYLSWSLLIVGMVFIVLSQGRLYPLWTGVALSILMSIVLLRKIDMSYPLLSYLTIFPFFLLSNGILTGSFLPKPIVWYNDAQNFGLRIFTIPIEDSMYGLVLILGNILLFDFFRKSKNAIRNL